jgi:hypothetical protein
MMQGAEKGACTRTLSISSSMVFVVSMSSSTPSRLPRNLS